MIESERKLSLSAVSFAPNKMVAQVADNGFENNLILKK